MFTKKNITILAVVIILLVVGIFSIRSFKSGKKVVSVNQLEELKKKEPKLAETVDLVIKWDAKLKEDLKRIEGYSTAGLVWKRLADESCGLKIENCEEYYKKALEIYKQGIDVTKRQNTLFMVNAGNMEKYLKDFSAAAEYYKEAISVAPGDVDSYKILAELYEYDMKKSKDEIIAVFDEGIKRVINKAVLEKAKESYLERVSN